MKYFVSIPISTKIFTDLVDHVRKNDLGIDPVDAVELAVLKWIDSSDIDASALRRKKGIVDNEILIAAISKIKGVNQDDAKILFEALSSEEIAILKRKPNVKAVVASILAEKMMCQDQDESGEEEALNDKLSSGKIE